MVLKISDTSFKRISSVILYSSLMGVSQMVMPGLSEDTSALVDNMFLSLLDKGTNSQHWVCQNTR